MDLKTCHWHQHTTQWPRRSWLLAHPDIFMQLHILSKDPLDSQRGPELSSKRRREKETPFSFTRGLSVGIVQPCSNCQRLNMEGVFLCSTKLICLGAGRFPGSQLLLTSSSVCNWENLPVRLLRPCWQHCPLKNIGEGFSSLHLFLPLPSLLFLLISFQSCSG